MEKQKLLGIGLVALAIVLLAVLSLVKADVDRQNTFLCDATSAAGLEMENCPAHQSKTSWFIVAGFGIAFAVLVAGVYLSLPARRTPEAKKDFVQVDESKLDDEEKAVYNTLKSGNGTKYQGDLVRETGFSKVKITRILDRLETKGIIERKRRGMTNIVVLK